MQRLAFEFERAVTAAPEDLNVAEIETLFHQVALRDNLAHALAARVVHIPRFLADRARGGYRGMAQSVSEIPVYRCQVRHGGHVAVSVIGVIEGCADCAFGNRREHLIIRGAVSECHGPVAHDLHQEQVAARVVIVLQVVRLQLVAVARMAVSRSGDRRTDQGSSGRRSVPDRETAPANTQHHMYSLRWVRRGGC